jgi:hypothetical protein
LVVIVTNLRVVSTAWNTTNNSFWRLVVAVTNLFLVHFRSLTIKSKIYKEIFVQKCWKKIWYWELKWICCECTLNKFTHRSFSDGFGTCLAPRTLHMWSL